MHCIAGPRAAPSGMHAPRPARSATLCPCALRVATQVLDDDGFDTDMVILTGELTGLIPDLLDALGGEIPDEKNISFAAAG